MRTRDTFILDMIRQHFPLVKGGFSPAEMVLYFGAMYDATVEA